MHTTLFVRYWISRITEVWHTTVMRWVKKLGDDIEKFRKDTAMGEIEPISIMELDEMWHFVQKKNKCWVWLTYDRDVQTVCGFQLGNRDTKIAQGL